VDNNNQQKLDDFLKDTIIRIVSSRIEKAEQGQKTVPNEDLLITGELNLTFGRYAFGVARYMDENSRRLGFDFEEYNRLRDMLMKEARLNTTVKSLFSKPEDFADGALRYCNNGYVSELIGTHRTLHTALVEMYTHRKYNPDTDPPFDENKYKKWYQPLTEDEQRKINTIIRINLMGRDRQ
jgi:hypothetical protein